MTCIRLPQHILVKVIKRLLCLVDYYNGDRIEIVENEDEQIVIDYYRGLPRITVPLPSRKEKCRFTLKPISNTVRDLTTMIQEEDRGIDRVILHTKDGVRISSSCSIEVLLEEEEFYLSINDRTYRICSPPAAKKSFTKDDVEKLGDVRILIAQLYESLHVKEFHVHKEQELLSKLEKIQSSLDPLEEQRKLLEKKAGLRTSVLTWVGLGMMSVQFGILARLTWWEYSWDIMEPVTYFVTYGTAMATYAYFALTKQDYILPDVRDRQHLITLHKKACKLGFDLNQYNTLKDQLANVKMDLERLRDPLIPPHTSAKVVGWIPAVSFFVQLSQFSSSCLIFRPAVSIFVYCLNFRLDVSFFIQLSQFSSSCLNIRLDVSFFVQLSHFSSGCLNFRLDVSFFVELSQFSSSCLIFRPDVSINEN
ncbi:hypothetical protein V9T40_003265 [Parthenolecanium corni]|uniref:Calcium uniporter protein n=1 Tax=Parthenolecanium corni TaxID=536013 RepID=A0AAN9TS82_9HEMI